MAQPNSFIGAVKEFKDKLKNAPAVDTSNLVSIDELKQHLQETHDAVFETLRKRPELAGS